MEEENDRTRIQLPGQVYSRNVRFLWVENLETPAPPPAVRSLSRKKKKKNSKKWIAVSCEDSDEVSSENEKPPSKKKFCQYNEKCSRCTDEYTTLKALIKKAKFNKSKGHRKGGKETYTKHKVNVLIEKELNKAFKGRKKCKQEMEVSEYEESDQSLDDSDASS